MSFASPTFLIFLMFVLSVRFFSDRMGRWDYYLGTLVCCSLVFYGWHIPAYLGLILLSTVIDFGAARMTRASSRPKIWLILSIVTNLGLLAYFKYTNFALETLGLDLPALEVVLPIGISFYTFQSMSYTIDVYRGKLEPVKDFWRLLLYVSFFPQLVAGPIVRSDFMEQFDQIERLRAKEACEGVYLILRGYFLKLVLSDNLSEVVDQFWEASADPRVAPGVALSVLIFFSCQIFCDFAGYSSIARGLALLLGFHLPVNFRSPYIATSFSDFWRRWHITLSTWLRDYLYISLGGNRGPQWRTYLNLSLTMLLGGLWHGAALTFIVWGAMHGLALVAERAMDLHKEDKGPLATLLWAILVQAWVLLTWLFFRADSCHQALSILENLLNFSYSLEQFAPFLPAYFLLLPVLAMHLTTWLTERHLLKVFGWQQKAILSGVMLYLIATLYGPGGAFVYFQF